ncbi:MAG: hypothetical protein IK080_04420 [Clostridia bacterium]|nr:hypothetical protein [Clostridia bacterium]
MKDYFDRVHRWGVLWDIGALLVLLTIPITVSAYFGAWPSLQILARVLPKLLIIYWTTAVVEIVTYVPMLGAGGTYLSFVTGNIANLKLPCGLNAMEGAGVRANTEEGEVISTIGIAVSAITTTVIIAVGVLAFAPVLPKITAEGSPFKAAFEQVLPALFGALGASYFVKHWRLAFAPIAVGVLVLIFAPSMPVGTLMFITIVASLVGAILIYKELFFPLLKSIGKKKKAD